MLNIKLIGYNQAGSFHLRIKIVEVIQAMGLGKDTVITWVRATVKSCDGSDREMPYIEVADVNVEEAEKIAKGLQAAGINEDMEIRLVSNFFPAIPISDLESGLGRSDDAHEA